MSDILIKNMKLPESCWECLMLDGEYGKCKILNGRIIEMSRTDSREEDCPLVEVPSRHGRMIDTDTKRARNCYDVWLYWLGQDRTTLNRYDNHRSGGNMSDGHF